MTLVSVFFITLEGVSLFSGLPWPPCVPDTDPSPSRSTPKYWTLSLLVLKGTVSKRWTRTFQEREGTWNQKDGHFIGSNL